MSIVEDLGAVDDLSDVQKKALQILREQERQKQESQPPPMCDFCGLRLGTKRCAKCKLVHYCSVPCQKQGWSEHRKVCGKPTGAKAITHKPAQPEINLASIDLTELDGVTALATPASTEAASTEAASTELAATDESTALAAPGTYIKPTYGLSGGFLDDGSPAVDRRTLSPYNRAMLAIGDLNDALETTQGSKRLPVLRALTDVLTELLDPACTATTSEELVQASRMHLIDRGNDVLRSIFGFRSGGRTPTKEEFDEDWGEEVRVATMLIELTELLVPSAPEGRRLLCAPLRTKGEIYSKGKQTELAIEQYKAADAAAAPGRDLDAMRKLVELYMDPVVGNVDDDDGITPEQDARLTLAIDAAREVIEVAGANFTPWDRIQLSRYLFWTVSWRGLDAATCPEAHEAFVLAQQMQASSKPGMSPHDMGDHIIGSLNNMGYNSALDGLE